METDRLPRRLAAVLYADVAGYSRLTEADEDATYLRLRDYLDVFFATIAEHGGRVMNTAGDAVLAMFESASEALLCAARLQSELAQRNEAVANDRRVRFRIGLNLGDVIEDRGDIFGDGVNVAARLEGLAEPGGICLSGSFHDALGKHLPFDYEFLGEQRVKNIQKPVRAYRAVVKAGAALAEPHAHTEPTTTGRRRFPGARWIALALLGTVAILAWWLLHSSDEPAAPTVATDQDFHEATSLVVLPFVDMTGDPAQEYFVDGITEDLITDLSRLSGMRVIAENTSFKYKGQQVKSEQIGAELGVNFVLEGSVRKFGDRVRITAKLVDARDGSHVWVERYDRKIADIFALQDEVTKNIVNALEVRLTTQEREMLRRSATTNLEAYDLFLQGQKSFKLRTNEGNREAQEAYKQAISLDPHYARAHGALAVALAFEYRRGWAEAPVETADRALEMARKAVELDDSLPQAYWALGYVHLIRKEYEEARRAVEQAVATAPSYADGYGLLALISNSVGRPEDAVRYITRGMSLNPYYTWDYPYNLGRAYYQMGRYPEAIKALEAARERNENDAFIRLMLTASYVRAGRLDDAEWEVEQLRVISPTTTLSHLKNTLPMEGPARLNAFLEDLRRAGLPE